jgi:L-alanine-DL-glutamate epimerase-like enolase superfamily enzyme
MNIPSLLSEMIRSIRNLGRPGISSMAIAAVDNALWDLKSKLLNIPLTTLLGAIRQKIAVYGSGGFISYSDKQLQNQFEGWANAGIRMMKMKIGRDLNEDKKRIRKAKEIIGDQCELFIDANGAYSVKEAMEVAQYAAQYNVKWFEEPVSSDDLEGLSMIRKASPAGMNITAGEYGYSSEYFRRMLSSSAVDVLQIDATRCAGISGFMEASVLSSAFSIPVSAHTAPAVHLAPCCSAKNVMHIEYFHDHARIEQMLFDGPKFPVEGFLIPDTNSIGAGIAFRHADAEKFRVHI